MVVHTNTLTISMSLKKMIFRNREFLTEEDYTTLVALATEANTNSYKIKTFLDSLYREVTMGRTRKMTG